MRSVTQTIATPDGVLKTPAIHSKLLRSFNDGGSSADPDEAASKLLGKLINSSRERIVAYPQ